ncbi:MAG TPA: DNA polymerase III subunit beta [Methylothermaceae bacterium]|nr:DNA polymerase III subunit beta [Methylothermaceae bacterium]
MHFTIVRELLLEALQKVAGVIERRSTLPILANVLLRVQDGRLTLVGTDLEVELITSVPVAGEDGETTVPARKLLDICRLLPGGVTIQCQLKDGKALELRAGRSRFALAALGTENYPEFRLQGEATVTRVNCETLRRLLGKTMYAMALQDVRYYLNGLLLELDQSHIRAVASDGHRLAWCEADLTEPVAAPKQPILPRKGVQELFRLLDGDEAVTLHLTANAIRLELPETVFSAKLIDGRYPDYRRVFPQEINRVLTCNRQALKEAISRVSILSNEQYRGIRPDVSGNLLRLSAHNPEQEEAEEELEVRYEGEPFTVGFNAAYLTDAVGHLDSETIRLSFADPTFSCLAEDPDDPRVRFIIMPMRL